MISAGKLCPCCTKEGEKTLSGLAHGWSVTQNELLGIGAEGQRSIWGLASSKLQVQVCSRLKARDENWGWAGQSLSPRPVMVLSQRQQTKEQGPESSLNQELGSKLQQGVMMWGSKAEAHRRLHCSDNIQKWLPGLHGECQPENHRWLLLMPHRVRLAAGLSFSVLLCGNSAWAPCGNEEATSAFNTTDPSFRLMGSYSHFELGEKFLPKPKCGN